MRRLRGPLRFRSSCLHGIVCRGAQHGVSRPAIWLSDNYSLYGLQKASQRLANDLRSGGAFGLGTLEELVAQLGVQSD